MSFAVFTPAEKRLALLLFLLTLIGLLARGGRKLSPEVSEWLDEVADRSGPAVPEPADSAVVQVGETPGGAHVETVPVSGKTVRDVAGSVDPNRATLDELTTLPGVGPVLARRILEDRDQNGRYTTIEDLLRVSGIGKATLERLRSRVAMSPPP